jgi:hypothetical protein
MYSPWSGEKGQYQDHSLEFQERVLRAGSDRGSPEEDYTGKALRRYPFDRFRAQGFDLSQF